MSNSLKGQALTLDEGQALYEAVVESIKADLIDTSIVVTEFCPGGSLRRKTKPMITDIDMSMLVVEAVNVDYTRKKKWRPEKLKAEIHKLRNAVFQALTEADEEQEKYQKIFVSGLGIHFLFNGTQVDIFIGIPVNWAITKLFWSGSRFDNEERIIKARYKDLYIMPYCVFDTAAGRIAEFNSEVELLEAINVKVPSWLT